MLINFVFKGRKVMKFVEFGKIIYMKYYTLFHDIKLCIMRK